MTRTEDDDNEATDLVAPLPFEHEGYGVNVPGAWMRLYSTMQGYCGEFGWRAAFMGGGE